MIEINPNALYTRSDLINLLEPVGIKADSFVARIRPRKVFRPVWLGKDLLDAIASAPPLADRPEMHQAKPARFEAPAKGGAKASPTGKRSEARSLLERMARGEA